MGIDGRAVVYTCIYTLLMCWMMLSVLSSGLDVARKDAAELFRSCAWICLLWANYYLYCGRGIYNYYINRKTFFCLSYCLGEKTIAIDACFLSKLKSHIVRREFFEK